MAEKAKSEEPIPVDPTSDFEGIGLCSSLPVVVNDIFLKLLPNRSNWTTGIKKLMFDGDKMFDISTDKIRFASIMEHFSDYEIVENLDPFLINELIKKWNLSLKEFSFKREFPFFLVLLYRFFKYHQKYEWDEIEPFVIFCIEMFEQLIPDELAETLISFLKMKDFDVSFGDKKANTSVFVLLTKACQELMNFSENFKYKNSNHVFPKRLLYSKMLWISVYLKCLGIKRNITKADLKIWHKSFMKVKLGVHVNEQTVSNELKQGLSIAVQLKLPFQHQFSLKLLVEFLVMKMEKRPLSFISNIITGSEEIIKSHEELMSHVLIKLRSYDKELLQSSDLIVQGILFLESMSELRMKKKWIEGVHWEHFRNECLNWIAFLIGTINVTNSSTPQLLKTFLKPTKGSMIDDAHFRGHSIKLIMKKIQESFPALTIQLFLSLYNLSTEWSDLFLSDYLKQCHIPSMIKINHCKWSDFFEAIFEHNHSDEIFLEFLKRVSDQYRAERRACDFIPDLLQLKFPDLFFTDAEAVQNEANFDVCGEKYFGFLKRYIQRNNLRYKIISRIHEIITSISEDKQTQICTIVFSVLYLEIVPELNSSLDIGKQNIEQFECVLELSVNNICQKCSLSEPFSPQINFYWGVIAAWCSKIPVKNEKFDWIMHLMPIIMKLLTVFSTYCEVLKLSDENCLFTTAVPQEIACLSCDVHQYFLWVKAIQSVLLFWQDKLRGKRVNYDEMQMYDSNHEIIVRVGQAVYAERYITDLDGIEKLKHEFASCFENLNCYLVRYVSDHPEVSYCILPELLRYYGVSLPQGIQEVLRKNVISPGNESNNHQNISIAENSCFNPNQNISLKIKMSFYLSDIKEVLDELKLFLEPITNHMEMLVFFHLHKSEIFETHIQKLLGESMSTSQHLISRHSFPFTQINDTEEDKERPITINDFQCALSGFKDFLLMVIKGEATYSNINANGTLQLERLKLEDEVAILTMFSESFKLIQGNCEGLEGLKCMLELFKLLDHIVEVQQVCEQYDLEVCLKDESLREMIAIAEELNLNDSQSHLTLIQAKEKMAFLKEIIHQQLKCTNYTCFSLFPTVANSMAFYQFIKGKHFYGSKGRALFHEHYQLVTAQLQHEKYDESVLNHLRVAYELMTPFMEKSIRFCDLLGRISKFDVSKGLKQLETVNENILLIRLWFSKAEGDTIENVEKELEDILSTGTFQFQLGGCSCIQLVFLMLQNTESQRKATINGTAFEDSILNTDDSSCSNTIVGVEQKWTNERIADFVRKLGFLDTKTAGGEKIRQFLYLNLPKHCRHGLWALQLSLNPPRLLLARLSADTTVTVPWYSCSLP